MGISNGGAQRSSWMGGLACVLVFSCAQAASELALISPDDASLLAQAKQSLQAGENAAAYRLLQARVSTLAGQPDFDYLLGQAALLNNQPTRAAFAFERCLTVEPRNGACRLGMARAHISLTEIDRARSELDTISRSSPPAPVQKVVADYLAQLSDTQTPAQDTRLRAYVQVGSGFNSNINTATSQESMAIPAFGGLIGTLSRDGRRHESGFSQATLHIDYSRPLSTDWRLLATANLMGTGNWATSQYNSAVSDASIGVVRSADRHQFTAKLQAQHYKLDGHSYRNILGGLGQYAYSVSDRSQLSAFVQISRLTYPGANLRDANRYVAGASWSQVLSGERAVVYASFYGGLEDPIHADAQADFEYQFGGTRVGGMVMLTPKLQMEAAVGAELRRYQGQSALFLKRRKETLYDGSVGVNYSINRKLSLRPHYRYTFNDSTIPLREYDRHIIGINLRYELF